MAKIQVFIITYNRPNLVLKAIDSVLNQTFTDYDLSVSDNSPNNDTEERIRLHHSFDSFKYIHRCPTLSGIDHINQVISEVTSDYFMIFHDDDIMHVNMLEQMYLCFQRNSELIAVGSNARSIVLGKYRGNYCLIKKDCLVNNPMEMIERYLLRKQIVPFPSYLYRKDIVGCYSLNVQNGGKYSDAAFIIDICKEGKVQLVSSPLMDYYTHEGQDSFNNSFLEKNKLIKYFLSYGSLNRRSSSVRKFRIDNIYAEIITEFRKNGRVSKPFYFLKFLFFNSLSNYFPKLCIRLIFNIK